MFCIFSSRHAILFFIFSLQLLTSGCATVHGKSLPVLVKGEKNSALITAHQQANKAYLHCLKESQDQVPWAVITSSATFLTGATLATGGAATAIIFNQDPRLFPLGVGIAATSAGLFVLATWSAFSIPEGFHQQRIRDAALKQSRYETMLALDENDADALLRVKRNLYENCRVATLAVNGDAGDTLLRDYARYRREAHELRRWHKDLQEELNKQKELSAKNKKSFKE